MKILIKVTHVVEGVVSDLGGYPYTQGATQNIIKDAVIHETANEADVDEENKGGVSYVSYVFDTNITRLAFIIQESERSLFASLKYHSEIVLIDENLTEYELINIDVEIAPSASYGKYLCLMDCKTIDSFKHITGNEL